MLGELEHLKIMTTDDPSKRSTGEATGYGPGRRSRSTGGAHRAPDHTGGFLGGGTPVTGPPRGWRPVSYFLKKIGKRYSVHCQFTLAVQFAEDMYSKQPKMDDDTYNFDTVNVLHPQSWKRLSEIERCYAAEHK